MLILFAPLTHTIAPIFHRGMCMMLPMTGDTPEGQCDEYDTFNGDDDEEDEE